MKAMLVFHLPEEQSEYQLANMAGELAASVSTVIRTLHEYEKYHELKVAERKFLTKLIEELRNAGVYETYSKYLDLP